MLPVPARPDRLRHARARAELARAMNAYAPPPAAGRFVVPSLAVAIDAEARLARGVFPCRGVRTGGDGELADFSLEPGAVDLGLARAGRAPLLLEHRRYVDSLLGGVVAAVVEGGLLAVVVRF